MTERKFTGFHDYLGYPLCVGDIAFVLPTKRCDGFMVEIVGKVNPRVKFRRLPESEQPPTLRTNYKPKYEEGKTYSMQGHKMMLFSSQHTYNEENFPEYRI